MNLPPAPDYGAMLPAWMRPAIRANVVEGFRRLDHLPLASPDVSGLMGVILADDDRVEAAVVSRARALEIGKRHGVKLEKLDRFLALLKPDALGVMILTPQGEGFIEQGVEFIHVQIDPEGQS